LGRSRVVAKAALDVLRLRPFLMYRFDVNAVSRFVCSQLKDFQPDVFWGYQASSAPMFRHAVGIGRVFDMVDSVSRYVSAVKTDTRFSLGSRMQSLVQGRVSRFERDSVAASHVVLVNSEADRMHLGDLHGFRERIEVLPNCVPSAFLRRQWAPPLDSSTIRVLFVGNLAYAPNAVAVRFFAQSVVPVLRNRGRAVTFVVVGRAPSALAAQLRATEGVVYRGFVPDLASEYLNASVLVVPVPHAGGAQYKLLEAMAIGVPVVASAETAAATGLVAGERILVASDPIEYARGVECIVDNPALALQLGGRGRAWIREGHTWESYRPLLDRVVDHATRMAVGESTR
jgi:glycosyltransferase involved in cell wall biosynthesis